MPTATAEVYMCRIHVVKLGRWYLPDRLSAYTVQWSNQKWSVWHDFMKRIKFYTLMTGYTLSTHTGILDQKIKERLFTDEHVPTILMKVL